MALFLDTFAKTSTLHIPIIKIKHFYLLRVFSKESYNSYWIFLKSYIFRQLRFVYYFSWPPIGVQFYPNYITMIVCDRHCCMCVLGQKKCTCFIWSLNNFYIIQQYDQLKTQNSSTIHSQFSHVYAIHKMT